MVSEMPLDHPLEVVWDLQFFDSFLCFAESPSLTLGKAPTLPGLDLSHLTPDI